MMSMMRLHDNKDKLPFIHKHVCPEDKFGQPMTHDEMQSFSAHALFDELRACGNNPHIIVGDTANEIDMYYKRHDLVINVKVIYQHNLEYNKDFHSEYLIKRYRDAGEIPHIVLARAYCHNLENGIPAICGANFSFIFYPISVIPDEKNFILPVKLPLIELAKLYAKAWNHYDASIIEPYLDKDFRYSSEAVYEVIPSRFEYIDYLEGKLQTIKTSKCRVQAQPITIKETGDSGIFMKYFDYSNNVSKGFISLNSKDGRLTSARMHIL